MCLTGPESPPVRKKKYGEFIVSLCFNILLLELGGH